MARTIKTRLSIALNSLGLLLYLSILGCSSPASNYLATAARLGFENQLAHGTAYQHRIFFNSQAKSSPAYKTLHVYLDGDGTPWIARTIAAQDPTPRNPLVLELMAQDSMPAILLGRPCYYGLSTSAGCDTSLWTSHRYSEQVVASMSAALLGWTKNKEVGELVLIGYSGGGSLAALLAKHIKATAKLVTIAANLDTAAWCREHDYLPLTGSLNPIFDAEIEKRIQQFHFAGQLDQNVPASITESFCRKQPQAQCEVIAGYDHSCCWLDLWPGFVKQQLGR